MSAIDLAPATTDEESAAFREVLRDFIESRAGRERVRAAVDTRSVFDESSWSIAASQVGLQGLAVPEEFGGSGAPLAIVALAIEELAASLVPGPYLSTVIAAASLAQAGGDDFAAELGSIASGEVAVAVVYPALDSDSLATTRTISATVIGDAVRLDGRLERVGDAASCGRLLLVVEGDTSPRVCLVDLSDPTVELTPLSPFDLLRPTATVELSNTQVKSLALSSIVVDELRDIAATLIAAEQAGIIRAVIERDVAYSLQREAFGRVIGSFQAVKHQLAEFYCIHEQAVSMLEDAIASFDRSLEERATAVTALQCFVGPAAVDVATEGLRLLGGIGFTWDDDAHLYLRRATADEFLLGSPYRHRELLATHLGLVTA